MFLAEGQLGDQLLLTPALRAVKESFPGSHTTVLVVERRGSTESKPVLELRATSEERKTSVFSQNKNVDDLLIVNRPLLRSFTGFARLRVELGIIRFLRQQRFDAVICTLPEDRFSLWAFASGANIRVGQKRQGLSWLLNVAPDIKTSDRGVLEYYCDLIRALGAGVRSSHTEYIIADEATQWAEELFRQHGIARDHRVVVVHPGASGRYGVWTPERYANVMDMLVDRQTTVILLGGTLDEPVMSAVRSACIRQFIEINAKKNLARLAAVIKRSDLCITNDSGPRHLAIAVGVPSLALFRFHKEKEWGVYEETPFCKILKGDAPCPICPADRCLESTPGGDQFTAQCLRQVTVEDVMREVTAMLAVKKQQ